MAGEQGTQVPLGIHGVARGEDVLLQPLRLDDLEPPRVPVVRHGSGDRGDRGVPADRSGDEHAAGPEGAGQLVDERRRIVDVFECEVTHNKVDGGILERPPEIGTDHPELVEKGIRGADRVEIDPDHCAPGTAEIVEDPITTRVGHAAASAPDIDHDRCLAGQHLSDAQERNNTVPTGLSGIEHLVPAQTDTGAFRCLMVRRALRHDVHHTQASTPAEADESDRNRLGCYSLGVLCV